jgi:hypothetical protein
MSLQPPGPKFQVVSGYDKMALHRALLLYLGPPQSGKTELMCSWPNPFFIVFDPKIGTLAKWGHPYIQVDNSTQLEKDILPWLIHKLHAEHPEVETICFDTLSFMALMRARDVMGDGYEIKAKDGDWDLMNNWTLKVLAQITRLARSATLPKTYHVIAGCHEKEKRGARKNAQGNWEEYLIGIDPAIPGRQVHPVLPGMFDVVLYLTRSRSADKTDPATKRPIIEAKYQCHAFELPDHRAPAGGTLWGKTLPPLVDGTYAGLRKACGLDPEEKT